MFGTLVMMHGMSGTAEKMMPLAKQLVPNNWDVFCPQAQISHPILGGFAWWLREGENQANLGDLNINGIRKIHSTMNNTSPAINYIDQAYHSLNKIIEELPEGPLIVGGFSQGGAMASMMLERNIQDRIVGLILIGTMTINPKGLKSAISNTWQRPVLWMHGEKDQRIPISVGEEHIKIFEDAGWKVIKLQHQKGHIVDISQIDIMAKAIDSMADI